MDRASKLGDICYTGGTYILCQHTRKSSCLMDVKSFEVIFEVLLKVIYTSLNEEMEDITRGRQQDQMQEMLENAKSRDMECIRGKARDEIERQARGQVTRGHICLCKECILQTISNCGGDMFFTLEKSLQPTVAGGICIGVRTPMDFYQFGIHLL